MGAFAAVGGRGLYCRCVGVFYAVWTDASEEGFDEAGIGESNGTCRAIVVYCEAEEFCASRAHFYVVRVRECID